MKSIQIIKKLNNTEIGKGGTHETYVLVPQSLNVSDVFGNINEVMSFFSPQFHKEFKIRLTSAREKRIVGLGPFYSQCNIQAGDNVIFEKNIYEDKTEILIRYQHYSNRVVLQCQTDGFEVLSGSVDMINSFPHYSSINGIRGILKISFKKSAKKRSDSPMPTDFYDLLCGDQSFFPMYSGKELVEVILSGSEATVNKFCVWEKHIIETE